jgi:hypothetical protein
MLRLLRLALVAAVLCGGVAAAPSDSLAEPTTTGDTDTQAALDALRGLTPSGQAAVVEEMNRLRHAGELAPEQVTLLAGIVESSPWTAQHRRQVGYLLALLGADAKTALERLTAASEETTRSIAADALKLHTLATQVSAPEPKRREAALQELAEFAQSDRDAKDHAVEVFAAAYTRNDEPRRDVRVAALRALLKCGEAAAPALVKSLENPDPFFYQYSRAGLLAMGPAAKEEMIRGLEHRDPLVRQRLVYILVDAGINEEAAAAIEPLTKDRDNVVRKAATRALANYRARATRK